MFDDYLVINKKNETDLYDKNLKLFKKFDRNIEFWYAYDDCKYRSFTDKNTNREGIIDDKFNIVVDNLKRATDVRNDSYFTFQNGFKYGFMDYKGNILISFSIFDSFNDSAFKPVEELDWF